MDLQTANQPAHVNEPPVKQRDSTKWIVIVLLLLASIGTGIAYFIFTNQSSSTQQETVANNAEETIANNNMILKELYAWHKYTNTEHGYAFVYTGQWTISQPTGDVDFVLKHRSTTEPGIIEGKFLPTNQRTTSYCEEHRENTDHCSSYQITANREMIIDKSQYVETGKTHMLIIHPTDGAIAISITDSNFETDTALNTILTTIHFTDEALTNKMSFCPTSWSADRKTAVFNGVEFDAKDLDEQFIASSCQTGNNSPTPTTTENN